MNVCSVRTHMHADRYTDTGQILLGHFIVNRKKRKRGVRAGRLGGVVVVVVVVLITCFSVSVYLSVCMYACV